MRDSAPYPIPDASNVCSLESLLYFIWEREVIRIVKERGGEKPYTKDPVLLKYKFTNIRRRDDRVSRWVVENIIRPEEHRPHLWFTLLITRLINWPPALQRLIDDGLMFKKPKEFNSQEFSESLERYKAERGKVYTGAYMVYPTKMDPGSVKSLAIAKHIITPAGKLAEPLQGIIAGEEPLLEDFVATLSTGFGISTFIAGQVAADLTYCAQLDDAADLYTYAPIGPGSSRGLNYLLNRAPNAGWTQEAFNSQLMGILDAVRDELNIDDLTLHDVQNCMCEFSKYCRTVLGEGKPKTTYQPEKEF
jgi:hypothetical protein